MITVPVPTGFMRYTFTEGLSSGSLAFHGFSSPQQAHFSEPFVWVLLVSFCKIPTANLVAHWDWLSGSLTGVSGESVPMAISSLSSHCLLPLDPSPHGSSWHLPRQVGSALQLLQGVASFLESQYISGGIMVWLGPCFGSGGLEGSPEADVCRFFCLRPIGSLLWLTARQNPPSHL